MTKTGLKGKKKKKKKSKKNNFIDEVKRFSSFEGHSIGDWIVYKRVSDGKISVGEVKWFCMTSEGMGVNVIDKNLGNYQLGLCSLIEKDPSSDRIKNLIYSVLIVQLAFQNQL